MTFQWIEVETPGKIAIGPHPLGGSELVEDLADIRRQGVNILVSMLGAAEAGYLGLSEESKVCEESGLSSKLPSLTDLCQKRLTESIWLPKGSRLICRWGEMC